MSRVYEAASIYETVYFNTAKEAFRYRAGGDELPESIRRCDAAEECNRLMKLIDDTETMYDQSRLLLQELYEISPSSTCASSIGLRVGKFIESHPMAAATAADNDGGRSYGV